MVDVNRYRNWIPDAPAEQVGTQILVDPRQARVWQDSLDHFDELVRRHGPLDRTTLGHWSRQLRSALSAAVTARDTGQESGQHEHRDAETAAQDMYGLTRTDVALLATAGTLDQPAPSAGLQVIGPTRGLHPRALLPVAVVVAVIVTAASVIAGPPALAAASTTVTVGLAAAWVWAWRSRRRAELDVTVGPQITGADNVARRTLTIGVNPALSDLSRELHAATDLSDPLWDLYEQLTELADEAALHARAAGTATVRAYQDGLAQLAGRIERGIAARTHHHRDTATLARDLYNSVGLDDVTAAGLRERLTALDRQWDTLLPETSHTDPHTRNDTGELS